MTHWKMPPKAKVYEALSALVDGRVRIISATEAEVTSSSGDKKYSVKWSDLRITSNDNASRWQGYTGYPIIAVLLHLGKLNCDPGIAKPLAGVPWKQINDMYKRDYDKAVDHVLQEIETRGGSRIPIVQQVEAIYSQLEAMELERGKV